MATGTWKGRAMRFRVVSAFSERRWNCWWGGGGWFHWKGGGNNGPSKLPFDVAQRQILSTLRGSCFPVIRLLFGQGGRGEVGRRPGGLSLFLWGWRTGRGAGQNGW